MDPTLQQAVVSAGVMPTILNAPLVTIPSMMQMPGFISSMQDTSGQNMVQVQQQMTTSPQAMSPHQSSPPSYTPPHVGSPRNNGYQPTSYPTSPQATPYSLASHMPHHHSVMMDPELSSPSLSHHHHHPHHGGLDYDRSPSRSPHRYSPPVSSHSQVLYSAPNGSPPMARHSPIMRS